MLYLPFIILRLAHPPVFDTQTLSDIYHHPTNPLSGYISPPFSSNLPQPPFRNSNLSQPLSFSGIPIKYMMLASSTLCSFGSFIASGNATTILTGGSGKNGATIAVSVLVLQFKITIAYSALFHRAPCKWRVRT